MLVSQTPGGAYERFVGEVGEPATGEIAPSATEEPPEVVRLAEIAAEYGVEIVSPLP